MKKLQDKVAIITGAAMGMGASIAKVYAKYGAKLIMTDVSNQLEAAAEAIRSQYGAEVVALQADVTRPDQMKAAVEAGMKAFGRIDVAACNAGVCRLGNFLEMTDKERDFHIDVNIKGVWNTCQAVLPVMLQQGSGAIVIASSVTGDIVADPGESAYALTKAALVGLTKALAIEFAPRNIRVNCTQLGYARTPMAEAIARQSCPEDPESALRDMAKGIPVKRLASPDEVGELFAFLGSDESSYITGSQFVIDGAATIRESNMGV
ncbi:SDR family oxidoreductase UcpA [Desulfovibrio piger]|uniref:SDR family oxidoreductase UcpA n=1 Tax=Desulfovibrio piger TaxID=901 RepID=UPI0026F251B7|nr:SDR family oxidoreductase UcpA [Desulfovibrio piger]MDD6247404.1 SDR family oxidoreductase UcpA [Desulfovibrio piger]